MFKRAKRRLINSFAMSINDISSTIACFLCVNERALNLSWVIVKCSYVLSYLNIENDIPGVADVAPFFKTILMITTFLINSHFSWEKDWTTLTTFLMLRLTTNDWKYFKLCHLGIWVIITYEICLEGFNFIHNTILP